MIMNANVKHGKKEPNGGGHGDGETGPGPNAGPPGK
jgi:hypothetical protein